MSNDDLKDEIVSRLSEAIHQGQKLVIVHGGGPYIQKALTAAKIESEFIGGHRKTTKEALTHVEKTLKGEVNSDLVARFNRQGVKAVGLSGKDGKTVVAKKRVLEGAHVHRDLGRVGDVKSVNPQLIKILLNNGYLPILTCIASDKDGTDYNVNADIFAGHVAGALEAKHLVVLTDVDGLMSDKDDPSSLFDELDLQKVEELKNQRVIVGGMLPKVEACATALHHGAKSAVILNGTVPYQLKKLLNEEPVGTTIKL